MRDKDQYWDWLDRAMNAASDGKTEEALAWLDKALESHPAGAEAHNTRGEILWDEGRYEEALHEFEHAIQADPKFLPGHVNRADLLTDALGEHEEALRQCDELLAGAPELPRLDRGTEGELHYLKAKALFSLDDLDGALFLVRRSLQAGGDHSVYRALEGQILFELGRYEEARRPLERALAMDPESAHASYHLGLTLERLGADPAEIRRCFEHADALEPEQYPLPHEMADEAFRRCAEAALEDLPRSIREYVENVPVLVEDFPDPDLVKTENVSPQILGLFLGVPRTEASVTATPQDLDRVVLFKRNLEKVCRDEADLIEQIQITVKHEIGHYLGFSEEDLERLGLG